MKKTTSETFEERLEGKSHWNLSAILLPSFNLNDKKKRQEALNENPLLVLLRVVLDEVAPLNSCFGSDND